MKVKEILKLNYVNSRKTVRQCNNSIRFIEKTLKKSLHPILELKLTTKLNDLLEQINLLQRNN
jgi:hypothetical protein